MELALKAFAEELKIDLLCICQILLGRHITSFRIG